MSLAGPKNTSSFNVIERPRLLVIVVRISNSEAYEILEHVENEDCLLCGVCNGDLRKSCPFYGGLPFLGSLDELPQGNVVIVLPEISIFKEKLKTCILF